MLAFSHIFIWFYNFPSLSNQIIWIHLLACSYIICFDHSYFTGFFHFPVYYDILNTQPFAPQLLNFSLYFFYHHRLLTICAYTRSMIPSSDYFSTHCEIYMLSTFDFLNMWDNYKPSKYISWCLQSLLYLNISNHQH